MSAQVPPSLKAADIARFVHRAAQLESAKPVMAYWCDYWTAQQILAKGLHSADQDALTFTTDLMDKLEKFKSEHSNDESVTDDIAGKAVVEQFALETFSRADNAMRMDKATRQTADTFQAASTFFELLEIWGPLEPEIRQKIKFAKFHALRIARAIKNGEDPNLTNPKPEPLPEEIIPPLDPNDPEVLALNGDDAKPRQPSVMEIPDETDSLQANLARQSSINESIHPSRVPSTAPPGQPRDASANVSPLPGDTETFYSSHQADVSPVTPERKLSVGGNYFPRVPPPSHEDGQSGIHPVLPSAPDTLGSHSFDLPSAPSGQTGNSSAFLPPLPQPPDIRGGDPSARVLPPPPPDFSKDMSDPSTLIPTPSSGNLQNTVPFTQTRHPDPRPDRATVDLTGLSTSSGSQPQPPPQSMTQRQIQSRGNPYAPPAPTPSSITTQPAFIPPPAASSQPAYVPASLAATNTNVIVDDEAMLKAQKHARWAISALNFEDVPTAIKEFQAALQTLGAR